MDFQAQVEALTGITIGSGVTTAQLTQFLKDGVIDVTNRTVTLKPEEMRKFSRRSGENTSQGYDPNGAKIISVIREAGTDNDWRACREIPVDLQSRVTDTSSIHYASKFNPAFTVEDDGKIYVYPAPDSNPDTYKVYFVNASPIDGSGNSLEHDDSTIGSFPADKVYLVVIYASIKSLDHLVEASHSMPTIPVEIPLLVLPNSISSADVDFSSIGSTANFVEPTWTELSLGSIPDMNLPKAPVSPNMNEKSISFSSTAPTFNKPVLNLESSPTINDLSISSVAPVAPSLSGSSISFSATAPTYIPPVLNTPDYSDADTWINTEEDPEMSAARVQVIQSQIQEYQANIQSSVQEFNEANTEYTTEFQKATQNAQLDSKDEDQAIQKYSQELQEYQLNVNKEVQEFTNNMNKDIKLWESERLSNIQAYSADIQSELQKFNELNTVYTTEFQKAVQDAQLKESKESRDLQNYAQEVQRYQVEVNQEVQRWTGEEYTKTFNEWSTRYQGNLAKYNADIQRESARVASALQNFQAEVAKQLQKYQAETGFDTAIYNLDVQKAVTGYERDISNYSAKIQSYVTQVQKIKVDVDLMHQRSMKLQKEYDNAFLLMAPQRMQQQQQNVDRRRRRRR